MGKGSLVGRARGTHEEKGGPAKKRGKITKHRLVHIFSVKTTAAESGCGETGERKGRTMVIFRLIFYVCPASGAPYCCPTRYTHPLLLSLAFVPPRVPLSSLGSGLGPLITTGNHEIRGEEAKRRFLSRVPSRRDVNNLL